MLVVKTKNKHASQPVERTQGRSTKTKTVVTGVGNRDAKVCA